MTSCKYAWICWFVSTRFCWLENQNAEQLIIKSIEMPSEKCTSEEISMKVYYLSKFNKNISFRNVVIDTIATIRFVGPPIIYRYGIRSGYSSNLWSFSSRHIISFFFKFRWFFFYISSSSCAIYVWGLPTFEGCNQRNEWNSIAEFACRDERREKDHIIKMWEFPIFSAFVK